MARLTAQRMSGIKHGYWSAKTKEEVVQRLGAIEHAADGVAQKVCDEYCVKRTQAATQEQLDEMCEVCPFEKLMRIINGE